LAVIPSEKRDALIRIFPPGMEMGRKWELGKKEITLGRDSGCEIRVRGSSVSRQHARLSLKGGKRWITDLKSRNGSFVNDFPAASRALDHGDLLRIGDTIFKYLNCNRIEMAYHEEIYKMTTVDGLTGAFNKSYFLETLKNELSRARRYLHPLSLLLFDIDHFKKVNDTFGHLAGDRVLKSLAQITFERLRHADTFARYGGEEFAVLLPETGRQGATELAEQLRSHIALSSFRFNGEEIPVTVSIGVATSSPSRKISGEEMVQQADQMLYQAKSEGRNRVRS
jgi:diguanylate cyclase (GGDEF)-like protein